MPAPPGLFCIWSETDTHWRCDRCGMEVSKEIAPQKPFAGCHAGMRAAGVAPTDLIPAKPREAPKDGPGTELKKMLAWLGITATEGCACNARAAAMNLMGADACEERLEEIVGWLREEANRRRLPFVDAVARRMVRMAINSARKRAT